MFDNIRQKLADWIAPKLKDRRNDLERLVNTDALTGLANRRAFDLAKYKARRDNKIFVMIDGDNFGRVNKETGNESGDRAIRLLANTVRLGSKLVDANERVFRLGGDEFVVIVNAITEANIVINFVESFFKNEEIIYGTVRVGATAAIGKNLHQADRAMQGKKKAKKMFAIT